MEQEVFIKQSAKAGERGIIYWGVSLLIDRNYETEIEATQQSGL